MFEVQLQYRESGRGAITGFGEYAQMVLSLGVESALAWQVFSGTLT